MAIALPFFLNFFSSNFHTIKRKYANSSWGIQVNDRVKLIATRVGATNGHFSLKPKMILVDQNRTSDPNDDLGLGRMVDHFVFRRNFDIKTYEIGVDQKVSIETILNFLRETNYNHLKAIGLSGDGIGLSHEMCKKNIIWVIAKIQVVIDRYPMWGDIIQIDTWKTAYGKIGMYSNWLLTDSNTGEILIKASSVLILMNTKTRKLSKFPDEVRAEFDQYFMVSPPIVKLDHSREWSKQGQNKVHHVCNGLAPTWSDLDFNQHVNNSKYIGWVIQSVPKKILENYELASIALEYDRECTKDSVLRSHTFIMGTEHGQLVDHDHVNCEHVLELEIGEGGVEIMKGKTRWRLKHGKRLGPH